MPESKTTKNKSASSQTTSSSVAREETVINRAMCEELKLERASREKHSGKLVEAIQTGFRDILGKIGNRDEQRDDEFSSLLEGLERAYKGIDLSSRSQNSRSEEILDRLNASILTQHKVQKEEFHEKEKLQDKRLSLFRKTQESRSRGTRLIAIPGIVLAAFTMIYMLHTVNVMEQAMTSMSANLGAIQISVAGMTDSVSTMSQDTRAMSSNMGNMTRDTRAMSSNMGHMTRDMGNMSRTVSPAMSNMNKMMPWTGWMPF